METIQNDSFGPKVGIDSSLSPKGEIEIESPKFKDNCKSSQSSLASFDSLKKNFRKMNCQVDFVFREQIKDHKILDRSHSKQSQQQEDLDSSCTSVPKLLDFD